jgi:hypothetical protein
MATNEQIIIKTKDGQIIPAISPQAFQLAVTSVEDLDAQLTEIEKRARALPEKFETKADYDKAGVLAAETKSIEKLGDGAMLPFVELIKKAKTFVDQQKQALKNHGERIRGNLAPSIFEWDEREKRLAAAEEKRKQAEREAQLKMEAEMTAKKDAEAAEERKKQRVAFINAEYKNKKITARQREKFLREAGAQEEAECAKILADEDDAKARAKEESLKLKVKARTGGVAGLRRHTNYKATCYDQDLFKAALGIAWEKKDFQTYERLLGVMEVSDQLLGEKARDIEDDAEMMKLYPFVKATHEDKV